HVLLVRSTAARGDGRRRPHDPRADPGRGDRPLRARRLRSVAAHDRGRRRRERRARRAPLRVQGRAARRVRHLRVRGGAGREDRGRLPREPRRGPHVTARAARDDRGLRTRVRVHVAQPPGGRRPRAVVRRAPHRGHAGVPRGGCRRRRDPPEPRRGGARELPRVALARLAARRRRAARPHRAARPRGGPARVRRARDAPRARGLHRGALHRAHAARRLRPAHHPPGGDAMTSTTPAVEVHDLRKVFGHVQALDGLDLTVRAGEVAGFLGPNGAGKSTTIRVLLGLLRADSGSARLLGGDPWHDAVDLHRRLAYVPGDVSLWPSLTGGEAIDLLTRLRGNVDLRRKALLLERFELDPSKKARTYSKGNRQKVALVAAFASDVELLVLDEPTSGLDPLMESVFTQCVREVTAEGRSVLLSSHVLAEVEKLCDTVTIIRAGRTVQSGTLAELRHLTRSSVTAV